MADEIKAKLKPDAKIWRVARITNNPEGYPDAVKDSQLYPHLVEELQDEHDLFIVNEDDPNDWYPAGEFFYISGGSVGQFFCAVDVFG